MISKRTIEKVFETARVEEVIGDFVQLKKSGSNYKGLSPFTEERTPSFMVSPAKQIWKDFSSGKGGTVITFLMEHEQYSYPEAIKYIANKYNIEVEETERTQEQISQDNEKESLFLVSDFAKNYFKKNLFEEEGKTVALSYLKERNFNDEIIQKFEIGYSVNAKDNFSKAAIHAGYKLNFLEKTGLTIVKENENIDRFRGRVVFPIRSMSGRILGFGGRILGSSKNIAKYINSPESLIYQKSKVLYGIFESKQSIVKNDNCFLVEGYTDVIKMHQCGISNVVASSGTALTENQIRLINRLTKNITVVFDGDAAGSRAALRGIDLILEQGMNVKICNLPEGDDPDSFVSNKNLEEVQSYLNKNSKLVEVEEGKLNFFFQKKSLEEHDKNALLEEYNFVSNLIDQFKDSRMKKVFELRYFSGEKKMTWVKIGDKLNLSAQTAINLHNKGKTIIKKKLQTSEIYADKIL